MSEKPPRITRVEDPVDVSGLTDVDLATRVSELLEAAASRREEIDRYKANLETAETRLAATIARLREAQDELNNRCEVAGEL